MTPRIRGVADHGRGRRPLRADVGSSSSRRGIRTTT